MHHHRRPTEAQESVAAAEAAAYDRFNTFADAFASGAWSREDVTWLVERVAPAVEDATVRSSVASLTTIRG